jgi:hypothetical protein
MDENNLGGSISLFFERTIRKDLNLGVSAGIRRTSAVDLGVTYEDQGGYYEEETKLDAFEVPLTLYCRKALHKRWGILLGGGASFIRASVEDHWESWGVAGFTPVHSTFHATFHDETWSPHLLFKGEYFIFKSLSIGLNFRYLFSAQLDYFTGEGRDTAFTKSFEYTLYRVGDNVGGKKSTDLIRPNDRPFEQDFSGPRFGLGLRYYFGGGVP